MKTSAQIAESIERFQKVFWEKRSGGRPPVGVVDPDLFLPIKYARRSLPPVVLPEHLTQEAAITDYEFAAAGRRVLCDDWMPFAAPWRAVPWLEAACGCPVHRADGSMAAGRFVASLEQLAEVPTAAGRQWLELMGRETARLAAAAPEDCWISPTILRGPSDVLAAMRGLDQFYCDLHDDIRAVDRAARQVNDLLQTVLDGHFSQVPPRHGGYGHIYGYWAPGRTMVVQEDVLGMCSPATYRDVFQKYNADIVQRLAGPVLFHLHSSGMRHWRDVLAIPGLAGLEITVESNGPSLADLAPLLREVLEQSRLILFVDARFEELPRALRELPLEGLFLLLRADQVRSEEDFQELVSRLGN